MADVLSDIYDKIVAHKVKVEDVAPYYADHYAQYEKGQHWTCDSKGEKAISFAPTGMGSESACPARTITELFKEVAETKGDKIALRIEELPPLAEGDAVPGPMPLEKWKSWTFRQYYDDCRALAKAIIELGMQAHDAVNIFGFNSPEWFMANMAAILAGGKAAGIYPSDNEEQVQFKVDHSNGAVIFIENLENLNKVKEVINDVPYLKAIVTWACSPGEDVVRSDGSVVKTMKFEEILEMGKGLNDENLNARMEAQKPTHAAGLIYTSGTTGKPKAVMISHDNLIYESTTVIAQIQPSGVATKAEEERVISYLPLSHVAGMMVDIMCPIVIAATTPAWASANFARPYDLKRSTIGARLTSVEPTLFIGVPRVWEKIMEKLIAVGAQTTGLKKKLSTAAKARALESQRNLQLGGSGKVSIGFPLSNLLKLIKEKLGLAKCKFAFSGAAPMSKDCLEYFGSLNININEVYGMSECTGACTWSTDEYHTWASVGFELSGCEVKVFKLASDGSKVECPRTPSIFNAAEECQGEICFRGRNIMMGYMANDRLGEEHVKSIMKKNEEAIDSEGWLHSGDKGCIDARGMLKITGRYKELIIGAGGENIAPVPIEDNLKKLLPAISNVMMVGDKRKFNVALVTLKVEGATGELPGSDILAGAAAAVSLNSKTISEAMIDPVFIEYLKKGFDTTNANGDVVVSNASRIQKFTILPADFSVQTNELTATLKLKRSVVEEKYKDILDKMYASNDVYIPFYG